MTARVWIEAVLLTAGCAAAVAGTLGALAAPTVYARLHFVALVSSLAVPLVTAAVVVSEWGSGAAAEAFVGGLLVTLTSPVVTHATARAARAREAAGAGEDGS